MEKSCPSGEEAPVDCFFKSGMRSSDNLIQQNIPEVSGLKGFISEGQIEWSFTVL